MSQQLLGFAKLRGHSFWPAKLSGQTGKRLWVKFYGTEEFGSILNDQKHWILMNDGSLKAFSIPKKLKRPKYAHQI